MEVIPCPRYNMFVNIMVKCNKEDWMNTCNLAERIVQVKLIIVLSLLPSAFSLAKEKKTQKMILLNKDL